MSTLQTAETEVREADELTVQAVMSREMGPIEEGLARDWCWKLISNNTLMHPRTDLLVAN